MITLDTTLEDQLFRLLDGAPRGLTVERIRNHLTAAGAQARKDDIVRALRVLSERGHVQIGASRKWHIRRTTPGGAPSSGNQSSPIGGGAIAATPRHGVLRSRTTSLRGYVKMRTRVTR